MDRKPGSTRSICDVLGNYIVQRKKDINVNEAAYQTALAQCETEALPVNSVQTACDVLGRFAVQKNKGEKVHEVDDARAHGACSCEKKLVVSTLSRHGVNLYSTLREQEEVRERGRNCQPGR